MEWIYQFGDTRPKPLVTLFIVKVGAKSLAVATQVHLSSLVGPAADVIFNVTVLLLAVSKSVNILAPPPH